MTDKIMTFVIGVCGILLIILDNVRNRVISNYTTEDEVITIINIPPYKNDLTITLALGVLLVCIALFLGLKMYFQNKHQAIDLDHKLSNQESKIKSLIRQGKTNKEIAVELAISVSTVKTHINNIYRKLDINSREQLF